MSWHLVLTVNAALYTGLGFLLCALVWGVGIGALGRRAQGLDVLFAYPAGLLLVLGAAALLLLSPYLGVLSVALLVVPLVRLVRLRSVVRDALPSPGLALAVPLAALAFLGMTLGLIMHGPGTHHGSSYIGEMVFWLGRAWSARVSLLPFHDLLLAGYDDPLLESGAPALGGAFSLLGGDVWMLFAVALPVCFGASMCVGLAVLARRGRTPLGTGRALLAAALLFGAVTYPERLLESTPVTLGLPLVFPVYALLGRRRVAWPESLLTGAAFALTKVLALPSAILLVAAATGERLDARSVLRRTGIAVVALALLAGVAAVVSPLPFHTIELVFTPRTALQDARRGLRTGDLPWFAALAFLVAELLFGWCLWRSRDWPLLVPFLVTLPATWIVGQQSLLIGLGVVVAVVALRLVAEADAYAGQRRTLGWSAGGFAFSAAVSTGNVAGSRFGAALTVALVAAFAATTVAASPGASARDAWIVGAAAVPAVLFAASDHVAALCSYVAALAVLAAWRPERRRVLAGVAATAVVVAVLGAARAAQLHDLRLDNHPYRSIVTREVRMWKTVRARTEPGSLVFVSNRFGIARRGTDRWYPAIAERQLYIGAWRYTWLDPRKRLRRERLAANAAVVRGSLAPQDAKDASGYPRAYALLAPHDGMPPGAILIASGRRFRLVRLR